MDEADWERRLALVWASIDDLPEDEFLPAIEELAAELPADDPIASFERASALDSTGHSDLAVPSTRKPCSAVFRGSAAPGR